MQHIKDANENLFSFNVLVIYSRFVFSQKREGILQSQQVLEEITGNTEYVITVIFFFPVSKQPQLCK